MTDVGEGRVNLQVLTEKVLTRLSSYPLDKPVSLVIEFPAHFPALAVDEGQAASMIGDMVECAINWTARQELRIQAQIVATGSLPSMSETAPNLAANGEQVGPWALLSIADQHAPFLDEVDRGKSDRPSQAEMLKVVQSVKEKTVDQGGRFWVESLDVDAVCVWIALPLQEAEEQETDITRVRETVETRLGGGEETIKLLVQAVHDDVRGMLIDNFIDGGYEVIGALASAEVLSLARRETPDLIILDLQSRNPNGVDLAVLIRQEPDLSDTPILFLTEISGPGIGRRMETVDFLVQPAGASAILETVDQVLKSGVRPAARIMVVEPEDELREHMLQIIQGQGHAVVEARSAEEALALAERVAIGVVLVKATLAESRDYWLVRQLRQLSEDIDIYLMTEGDTVMDAKKAQLRGATGYGDTGRLRELLDKVDPEKRGRNTED